MKGRLPGTTVAADLSRENVADRVLTPLFLTGGLTLSQISQLTGLEPHIIQNWVKRGYLAPPQRKKYSRRQFCRVLIIHMLKDVLQLDKICKLISTFNGSLSDESDDLIDDSYLYALLCRLIGRLERTSLPNEEELEGWCIEALSDYGEPRLGARMVVSRAMRIILTAYLAAELKREAESLLRKLEDAAVSDISLPIT